MVAQLDSPVRLEALVIEADDAGRLATFWAGVLGRDLVRAEGVPTLRGEEAGSFDIAFVQAERPHADHDRRDSDLNQLHFDLTSESLAEQARTVDAALSSGARQRDVGQRPEEGHVVLADPEGNEFCVLGTGSTFLDGCGFLGALSCDGTREVGLFWHHALGWPLVWNEGEETAIQSPLGGPKITWGGPPVRPKTGRNRMHFALRADDQRVGTERLLELGATRTGSQLDGNLAMEFADPDGNEFVLRPAR